MTSRYEWDEDKNDPNLRAHGVAFPEAIKVFDDLGAAEEYDATHSTYDEPRYSRIGFSGTRLLFVVFTVRQGKTRIIHTRKADRVMEKIYVKQQKG